MTEKTLGFPVEDSALVGSGTKVRRVRSVGMKLRGLTRTRKKDVVLEGPYF